MKEAAYAQVVRRADEFLKFSSPLRQAEALLLLSLSKNPDLDLLKETLSCAVLGVNQKWVIAEALYVVFFRLGALGACDKIILDGGLLAQAMQRLLAAEVEPGGPYRDFDGSITYEANLAITFFLHTQKVRLPSLLRYLQSYAYLPHTARTWLMRTMIDGASHELRGPFHDKNLYKGASGACEFLALIYQEVSQERVVASGKKAYTLFNKLVQTAYEEVLEEIGQYPQPVRSLLQKTLYEVKEHDTKQEIAGISLRCLESLSLPLAQAESALLRANIYLWMSYTIYDDFLDDEGQSELVPVANICMRRCIETYRNVIPEADFITKVLPAFNAMDQANAWEQTFCRFPVDNQTIAVNVLPDFGDLGVLAERAAGHTVGPLLLLGTHRVPLLRVRAMRRALRHYLIARQLSDDLHDWKQDIAAGRITVVVAALLRGVGLDEGGSYSLPAIVKQLEKYFWETGFECVTNDIAYYANQGIAALTQCNQDTAAKGLGLLLADIKQSNVQSRMLYKQNRTFAQSFSGV